MAGGFLPHPLLNQGFFRAEKFHGQFVVRRLEDVLQLVANPAGFRGGDRRRRAHARHRAQPRAPSKRRRRLTVRPRARPPTSTVGGLTRHWEFLFGRAVERGDVFFVLVVGLDLLKRDDGVLGAVLVVGEWDGYVEGGRRHAGRGDRGCGEWKEYREISI